MTQSTTNSRIYPSTPIPAVSAVVFNSELKILFVKRATEPFKGKWSLPGGAVDIGESLEQALKRELLEECGIGIRVGPLISASSQVVRNSHGKIKFNYVIIEFLCFHKSGVLKADTDAAEAKWIDIKQIHTLELTEDIEEIVLRADKLRQSESV